MALVNVRHRNLIKSIQKMHGFLSQVMIEVSAQMMHSPEPELHAVRNHRIEQDEQRRIHNPPKALQQLPSNEPPNVDSNDFSSTPRRSCPSLSQVVSRTCRGCHFGAWDPSRPTPNPKPGTRIFESRAEAPAELQRLERLVAWARWESAPVFVHDYGVCIYIYIYVYIYKKMILVYTFYYARSYFRLCLCMYTKFDVCICM